VQVGWLVGAAVDDDLAIVGIGRADTKAGGGLSISSIGQQRWLDQHRRHSQLIMIGDRWPDTLATHLPPH
jgi:hypothetical protein